MGYQERDYYRDEQPTSLVTSVVVKLIILNCVIFLADALFGGTDHSITKLLAVHGYTLVHPELWWQFLTAGFVHDWERLNHIIFNMLGLYFFGKPLEERFGPREFLRYYLVAIVLGNVLWGARVYLESLSIPVELQENFRMGLALGASGGVIACVILFCLLYPRATIYLIVFPLPAWVVGILIVAMNLFGLGGENIAYDVHLFGAAFALAYWYFGWNLGRLPGMSRIGKLLAAPQRWFQSRPGLRIHDPEPDPEPDYDNLETEGDRILAKLHREGEGSLSAKERRILEDYSRRMRQKLR